MYLESGKFRKIGSYTAKRYALELLKDADKKSFFSKFIIKRSRSRMTREDRIYHANKSVQDAWCKLIGVKVDESNL